MNPKYWVTMGANLEKQVKNERPCCIRCGHLLSSEEIINARVRCVTDDEHTWYEHKQCSK